MVIAQISNRTSRQVFGEQTIVAGIYHLTTRKIALSEVLPGLEHTAVWDLLINNLIFESQMSIITTSTSGQGSASENFWDHRTEEHMGSS